MAQGLIFENYNEFLRTLDRSTENADKLLREATKAAAKQTAQQIKAKTPSEWRSLAGYKLDNSGGFTGAQIGLFHKKSKGAKKGDVPKWFKAYWSNYGTLERRISGHHFQRPIKKAKNVEARRRNKRGVRPKSFYEMAIRGWDKTYLMAIQKYLLKGNFTE